MVIGGLGVQHAICRSVYIGIKIGCLLALVSTHVISEPLRYRRQTLETYLIDTLMIIDDALFSRFQNWMGTALESSVSRQDVENKLKEYVFLVIHQANVRLANLRSSSFTLKLHVVDIRINKNVLGDARREASGHINSQVVLDTFSQWIQNEQLASKYDHAILLTGYILESQGLNDVKGKAYIGQMCNTTGYSVSIVQENGGFQSAHYVAHEVSHNLDSVHDGDIRSLSCNPGDFYIMAPSRSGSGVGVKSVNPWYYSSCSTELIHSFISHLTTFGGNCLQSSQLTLPEFNYVSKSVPGQLYPADVQCQMMYGKSSRVCLGSDFSNISDICTRMFCLDQSLTSNPEKIQCREHFAAEGTTCGNKKWCQNGLCVESESAPGHSLECPNGDSLLNIQLTSETGFVESKTCWEAVKTSPFICYTDKIKNECCESCEKFRTNSPECPYGDKAKGCKKAGCGLLTPEGRRYSDDCCGTCSNEDRCADASSIDGMDCPMRVSMYEHQDCYNTTVARSCCHTCSKLRTGAEDCPYGDYYQDQRCQNKDMCFSDSKSCCFSCRTGTKSTATSIHWTSTSMTVIIFLLCLLS